MALEKQKVLIIDDLQQNANLSLPPVERSARMAAARKALDIDFIIENSAEMLQESLSGVERIIKTVGDFKKFSRVLIATNLRLMVRQAHHERKIGQ